MTPQSWAELVAQNLQALGEDFRPNELAYLALTSKVEATIRDRLAYRLHQHLAEKRSHLAVAREWQVFNRKRFDLAVVTDTSRPRLLLEAKAMYSFDLYTSAITNKFVPYCSKDRKKLLQASTGVQPSPALLTLVLVTHPHHPEAITHHWEGIVKYLPDIKRIAGKSTSDVAREIRRHFRPPDFAPFAFGEIDGGFNFGTALTVVYALFGPHSETNG